MMIRKMSLPRRTFLRGVGATVALPFLDAMVPALSAVAKIPQHAPRRLVVYGTANGVYGLDFFPKAAHGAKLVADALPRTLRPLAPVLDQTVIVEGTSNLQAVSGDVGSGAHARCAGAFLSGVRPRRTEGADVRSGISLDQYAAQGIGQDTSLASLEMAMESSYVGNCDQGYSCSYLNTFAWHSPTQPLPMENNPRVIFERLFGEAGPVSARLAEMRTERSILDWVSRDLAELQRGLGAADRTTVDEYLEAVRDVEQRIQRAEKHGLDVPVPETAPYGIPEKFDDHAKLMVDLQYLALRADLTRVITFQTSREQSGRQFPFIGVPESHHSTSHHAGDAHMIAQQSKINAYFMQLMVRLATKMRATPDGDGTLLDHAMLLWSAPMGSGDLHSPHNMPIALVGGGCGMLKGGRYLKYELDTPFMNFGLTLLDKLGVHLDQIGDSTGRVADL